MEERDRMARLLRRHELKLTKKLGQHLLVDLDILERIASEVGADDRTDVVEVGSGAGNLTYMLALSGAHVTGLELDRRFKPVHDEVILSHQEVAGHIEFVYGDALHFDFAAAGARAAAAGRRFLIAGNIPYQITSPLVMGVLESGAPFESMTLMIQREVAERFAAGPGSRRNGAITIKIQSFCETQLLATVPRTAFMPPPEVESRLIRFRPKPRAMDAGAQRAFFRLVDAAFAQRRKMLPNSVAARGIGYTKQQVDAALEELGIAVEVRAEHLGLQEFMALFGKLQEIAARP